jgi:hypothetical protein
MQIYFHERIENRVTALWQNVCTFSEQTLRSTGLVKKEFKEELISDNHISIDHTSTQMLRRLISCRTKYLDLNQHIFNKGW